MLRRGFLATLSAAAATGFARAQSLTPQLAPLEELEPLNRVIAGPRGLAVWVTSHGCTVKADFAHFAEPKGEAVAVAFARRRLDRCRAGAREMELVFSYEELGLARGQAVTVLNPIGR